MQATFGLGEAGPAAGARVVAGGQAGAGVAAERAVALVEQAIVGHVMSVNVAPHIALTSEGERIELDQVIFRAPLEQLRIGAAGAAVAPNAGDPGIEGR